MLFSSLGCCCVLSLVPWWWSYIAWSEVGSNFHLFLLSFSLHSLLTKSQVNARRGNRKRHILLTNEVSSQCKQGWDRVGHGFVYTPPLYSTKTISGHIQPVRLSLKRSYRIVDYYCWLVWCERKILFWLEIYDLLRPSEQADNIYSLSKL